MTLMSVIRLVARRLPLPPSAMQNGRRMAAVGFRAVAWARFGWRRRRQAPRSGPIVVAGFHSAVVGIGEGARLFSATLRQAGLEVIDWDISADFGHSRLLEGGYVTTPPEVGGTLVLHLNPVEVVQLVAMRGPEPFAGRFCVGYWAWELPRAPNSWREAFRYVDEVWAPSRFVIDAVRPLAPPAMPLRVFPHPLQPRADAAPDRGRFGLPAKAVVVLTAFDMRSSLARKNPYAAVEAFRRAADRTAVEAMMVCKVAGRESAPAIADALGQAVAADPRIRFMGEWLTDADMAALIASADIILSLHRSEGFGLLLAQGMLAGKAVVATGWSGNMDFMTADNSAPAPFGFVPVKDEQGIYLAGEWAEPDVEAAAEALAGLLRDGAARRAMGLKAAAELTAQLSPTRLGAQARAWLGQGPAAG